MQTQIFRLNIIHKLLAIPQLLREQSLEVRKGTMSWTSAGWS